MPARPRVGRDEGLAVVFLDRSQGKRLFDPIGEGAVVLNEDDVTMDVAH
nr:hypothetical protein [Phenylobacterium sp.]